MNDYKQGRKRALMFTPTRNEEKERDVGRLNEEVSGSERGEEEKKMRWLSVSAVAPQLQEPLLACWRW